jgi:hypothetical protein
VVLTGQPPYLGGKSAEVYPLAVHGALEGAYARLEACGADAELVALARACLARERQERPRHAGVVADAVAAHQAQVQERLRQAEVARAQAQVKAAEERKRRRLTLALAALVAVLLGGGGAAGWWYQQEQARRALEEAERDAAQAKRDAAESQRRAAEVVLQEQAAREIKIAVGEALQLQKRARELVAHPLSWQATLEAAHLAVKRAEALLTQHPQLVAELLRRAQRAHPQDFWLIALLAQNLYQSVLPTGESRPARAEELPRVTEVIGFCTAALALRPESPGVHNNLGIALKAKGDLTGPSPVTPRPSSSTRSSSRPTSTSAWLWR